MTVKEFDVVRLKDGFEGTVLEVFQGNPDPAFLLESGTSDDDGRYPQRTVKKSEIVKVTYSAPK
ncbi:hypothetical protein [Sporolactobacillus terrae]|uniref:hypothetical protein n=1 Tax=Sporolactobacillus terrae TaxID=269673 RepID=UPI00048E1F3A|nr:hypothetical protein [Sporolactobacillus terrae]